MKFKSKAQLLSIIWRHILTPLGVLTLYCLSLYLFYDQILPNAQSVNTLFVTRTWKYSLVLTAVSYLIFFVVFKTTKGAKLSFGNNVERISVFDLILLLLPMTPVIQYVLNNQEILSPLGILYILGVFIIFSALYAVIVPTLLGPLSSAKTLMLLGVTFSFMIRSEEHT